MPLEKKILNQFVYLHHVREDYKDFNVFKRELENMLSVTVGDKDVVVDFTGSSGIVSSEIGLLVRLINHFKGTARFLRVVGTEKTINILKSTNLQNLDNFMIYKDQKAFLDEVRKMADSLE